MVDTIHVSKQCKVSPEHLDFLHFILDKPTRTERNGIHGISGKMNDLTISANENYFSIRGSWAKFFNGNNVEPFEWSDFEDCLILIQDTLDLPIKGAILRRIDIAGNIRTTKEPKSYFPFLLSFPYTERNICKKNTLYFGHIKSNGTSLVLYDKRKEGKRQKDAILGIGHLLRYEMRLARVEPIRALGIVLLKDLCTAQAQNALIDHWLLCYNNIEKLQGESVLYSEITTDKQCRDAFIAISLESYYEFIDRVKSNGGLQKQYPSKLRKTGVKLAQHYLSEDAESIIEELNEKVTLFAHNNLKHEQVIAIAA
jgi:hypothetical protein